MEEQMANSTGSGDLGISCSNNSNSSITGPCASEDQVDFLKTATLVIISVLALTGNVCTVVLLSRFKSHKLPDVLVIGLACTDIFTTCFPVSMSLYSYITLDQFKEGSISCAFYGSVAQFSRYSSLIIVTLISLERYFAINRPFIYRKYASPKKCASILFCCWFISLLWAVAPAVDSNTRIISHDGFCLFDLTSNYATSVLVYAAVQFLIVFVCFVLVIRTLIQVYRRRKKLRVQGSYNQRSQAREREHEVTFSKPKLTSRISDFGKSIKKAAPIIQEKFQLGVEAQFARMLLCVVILFYVSWTTLMVLILIAQITGTEGNLSFSLFWGIRLSVISTAINPFLYGLLARQYRMAFVYVLRKIFSCCCYCCISPPLKDVFASARNPGGEVHGETRQEAVARRRRLEQQYGTHGKQSQNGSLWSNETGQPVLTRTTACTHLSMDLLPELEEDYLSIIQEDSVANHSTYIPSVGELSSSVVIPHQARENYRGTPNLPTKQMMSSAHNLTDSGPHDQVDADHATGTHNPLAIIADIHGEEAVLEQQKIKKLFPPLEAVDVNALDVGKIFHNPVYEIERIRKEREFGSKKASLHQNSSYRNSFEALLSRKKPLGSLRSSPLSEPQGGKKALQASVSLGPAITTMSSGHQQYSNSSMGEVDQLMREVEAEADSLAPPMVSRRAGGEPAIRASAKTYKEMKRNLNPRPKSRPISSSRSFMDDPEVSATSPVGLKESHSSWQPLSLLPPVSHTGEDFQPQPVPASPTLLSPSSQLNYTNTHPRETSHIPLESEAFLIPLPPSPTHHTLPSSPHHIPTRHTLPSSPPHSPTQQTLPSSPPHTPTRHTLPSSQLHTPLRYTLPSAQLPAIQQIPPPITDNSIKLEAKQTVKELKKRFESPSSSLTSPSPTPSPTVPITSSTSAFSSNYTANDTDSGRESMVELVITDIDSSMF